MAVNDLHSQSPARQAISVSELNRQAKSLLEQGLAKLWVEGEVSNLARPASGHVYFTLKDESAQLRCAWFRQRQRGPTIKLKDGDQVLIFGRVSIYEARGDYQMIVEQLEEAGEGELRRRFEALKKKLAADGLFDDDQKRDLPELPRRVGLITSPGGAAVRDIITVMRRRFPSVPIVIYPTAVQGDAAAAQIVAALQSASRRDECDVLILGRGGGSLEDLWPFNEEIVARAVFDSAIPVVSAVGHEVDITIADFVADVRAPTPSGAAEIVVPDQAEWLRHLNATAGRLAILGRRYLEDRFQSFDWLSRRLTQSSPAATVRRQRDWLRNLQQVLAGAMRHDLATRTHSLEVARSRLLQGSPAIRVQRNMMEMSILRARLRRAGVTEIERLDIRYRLAARALDSVSPLATLDRGYAIVSEEESGTILTDASRVPKGARIRAQLSSGVLRATVTDSRKGKPGAS